jgi:prevent-host-death family protein
MRTFSIREAKTHLSRLIDRAAKGEPFVITKAGKPLVQVVALPPEAGQAPPISNGGHTNPASAAEHRPETVPGAEDGRLPGK